MKTLTAVISVLTMTSSLAYGGVFSKGGRLITEATEVRSTLTLLPSKDVKMVKLGDGTQLALQPEKITLILKDGKEVDLKIPERWNPKDNVMIHVDGQRLIATSGDEFSSVRSAFSWNKEDGALLNIMSVKDGAGYTVSRTSDYLSKDNYIYNYRAYPRDAAGMHEINISGRIVLERGERLTSITRVHPSHPKDRTVKIAGFKGDGAPFERTIELAPDSSYSTINLRDPLPPADAVR